MISAAWQAREGKGAAPPGGDALATDESRSGLQLEKVVVCATCRHPLTTVDARIVGTRVVQIQPDGQELTADAPPEDAFSYPGTWQKEFGTLSGFAIIREETFEGRNAVVIAQMAPSADVPGALDEQLIWIDRDSGRILRWDTNQYTGEGDNRTLTARSESSLWEYDQDVTVELP